MNKISDLKAGQWMEGVVTNVANFGAFVDIGVHQDGLVHISQISDRFVKDAKDVLAVGQVVRVRVLEADTEQKRIALSMKTEDAANAAPRERAPRGERPEGERPRREGEARPPRRDGDRPRGDSRNGGRPEGGRAPNRDAGRPQGGGRDEGRFQPQNNDDRRPQAPKGPAPTLENLMAKFGNGKNDKKQNNTKLAISVKSLMRGGR